MSKDNDNPPSPDDTTEEAISPAPPAGSASDPLIGTKIGSCTLKSIIGSGGMGTVYEAIQEKPRRRVALKMMKRGITSRSATRRFEFESQTLARLKHQGVAQIYEAGTHDDGYGGVPYFVMEYIPNKKTLTEYANDKKLGTSERLALFSMVCDAVQHGHLKGIVHRDLKPGNILVGSNGQPKIIDFGIARSTDSDMAVTTLQTDVGQLIGTLQYMSPEQCEADPSDIDTRSDVYSLGVILYELLTGKPPYDIRQMAIHEAVRIVREEEPTKLSTVDRHLRGDIETIALKALEKDRERRYQSATVLREDVQHYLNDEPIAARPPGAIDYLRRFAKKYRAAAVAIAAVVVVLVVAVVGISIFAIDAQMQRGVAEQATFEAEESNEQLKVSVDEATKARADAERQRELAEKGETDALRQAYFGNIHAAGAAIENSDLGSAKRRLETAREVAESLSWDPLPFEWRYLAAAADDSVNIVGSASSNWTLMMDQDQRAIAFNPSGTLLASAGTTGVTQILDSVTGEELFTFSNRMFVNSVDFSPDGTRLAVGGRSIQIWDMQSRTIAFVLVGHEGDVESVSYSPDGTLLASASYDETIRIWDMETGTILQTLTGHEGKVNAVAFSPDGTLLASCAGDKTLKIWSTQNWEIVKTIYQSNKYTKSIAFSPDGTRIAVGDWGKVINVWDTRSAELLTSMVGHEDYVESVSYSPDGTRLASSGRDKTIRIWDAKTGQELDKLIGHLDMIGSVTFSPDGTRLASSSDDGTLRTWEVENQGVLETVGVNDGVFDISTLYGFDISTLYGFAISPDSRRIALSSLRGFMMLDLKSNEVLWVINNMPTGAIEFSPDGQSLLTTDLFGGIVRLWDVQSSERRMIFSWDGNAKEQPHVSAAQMADEIDSQGLSDTHATFSPDGSQILLWGSNGVRLWDIESGKLTVITESSVMSSGVGFNPESDQLITAHRGDLQAWDPRTGEHLENYLTLLRGCKDLVFSPNGKLLATTDYEQKIVLWDTETRKQLFWLLGHEGTNAVSSIAFNADGSRLVSGGRDKTIRIWDTESGEELLVFFVEDEIRNVAFSPDNTRLFASGLHS